MALRKLLLILSLFIMGDCFGQSPMFKLIAKRQSSCSYLLDQYSGAAAAYSLRKLDCDYAGSAIRVRRSSDNTEQDIGFTSGGDLDTAALKSFVGTGGTDDGFVVTWYDQSGNGRNMTQSTSGQQPQIMDNGVVYREDGLPAISFFNSASTSLNATFNQSQPFTVFSACKIPTTSSSSTWYHILDGLATGGGNSSPTITYNSAITEKTLMYAGTILGETTARSGYALTSAIFDGSSSEFFYNNTSILSGNANTLGFQDIRIGRNWNAGIFNNVKYYELIIYGSDKTSDVSGINSNINTYWGIY